jgi:hypothetical protein
MREQNCGYILFAENLEPDIYPNRRDRYIGQLFAVLFGDIDDALSEVVPESYENPTPEGRSSKSNRDKWSHRHTENTSRDRDEMSNYGDESSDECVDFIIFEK